jgi:hypothetical protein
MKQPTALLITVLIAGSLAACTSVDYTSPAFPQAAITHQSVAVLPVEMVFTGKAPARLTSEDILMIEEGESLAFQATLYNYLLDRSSMHRRDPIWIAIQPIERTNDLLADSGLSIRDSWFLPAEEVAELLGVDAVVRTRVRKDRYLSDLASFGLQVGLHAAHAATDGRFPALLALGMTRTYDIFAEGELLAAPDGALLWKVGVHRATDWTQPANDVVRGITRKLAKKFPYRGGVIAG